jgi:hypothetical protein
MKKMTLRKVKILLWFLSQWKKKYNQPPELAIGPNKAILTFSKDFVLVYIKIRPDEMNYVYGVFPELKPKNLNS